MCESENAMETSNTQARPTALIYIASAPIVGGTIIGASTNAINGEISPHYFRVILHWQTVVDVWRASVAQGILEGLVYGVVFSVVFTTVVGRASHARCSFAFAFRHILLMILAVYCCWIVGGILAIGLAAFSPEFYRHTFYAVPDEFVPLLCYAWVGGSIWGEMFGSVLTLAIGSILFSEHWRRFERDG